MDNSNAVRGFFEENSWDFREEEGMFESGVVLDGDVEGALLQIDSNNGGIVVLSGLDYDIPEESFNDIYELCNMVNMLLPTGAMFLDPTEHLVIVRLGQYYGEGNAETSDVGEQVNFCLDMMERLGSVIIPLTEGGMQPEEAASVLLRPEEEAE